MSFSFDKNAIIKSVRVILEKNPNSVIEETCDFDAENSESLPKRNEISRLEIIKHLPTNQVTFKIGRKQRILIKHSCTIDYFLFGLWATFEKDPQTINNEIENLSKLEENYEHYSVICELINLIDSNNWAKAKYFWLHDHLKLALNPRDPV